MSLPNLPIELIEKICNDLETLDLSSLRLTCKALLQRPQIIYDRRHYGTIWMMVTSDSLRCLKEIAQDDYLRTLVKELVILPLMFEDQKPMLGYLKHYPSFQESPFGGYSWSRTNWEDKETERRFESFKTSVADHEYALKSLQEVLEGCLTQFANLNAFQIRSENTAHLLRAATNPFPGCFGLRNLRNQLKLHPNRYMVDIMAGNMDKVIEVSGVVLTMMLKAIIANNRNIRKLETCADRHGVNFTKLKLTPAEFQALIPLIEGIECLHICPRHFRRRGVKPMLDPRKAFIDLVLASAPSLTTLKMTYNWDEKYEEEILSELAPNMSFSRLRELHLSSIVTSLHDFKSFLSTATSTLEVLKLERVTLSDEYSANFGLRQNKKKLVHGHWREARDCKRFYEMLDL